MSQIGSISPNAVENKEYLKPKPIYTATRFFLRAPPGRSPQFPPMVNVFGTKDKTLRLLNSILSTKPENQVESTRWALQ